MERYWGGQSNRLNRPMEGDHESYDTKVFHLSKYTSNKKTVSKNTYPLAVVAVTDTQTHKAIHIGDLFITNECKLR